MVYIFIQISWMDWIKRTPSQKMNAWLEENGVEQQSYRLRDWLFSPTLLGRTNSSYPLGRWHNDNCSWIRIAISTTKKRKIRPSGTGESPLAAIEDWLYVTDPVTGKKGRR